MGRDFSEHLKGPMAVAKVGTTGHQEPFTTGTSWTSGAYVLDSAANLLTVRVGMLNFLPTGITWNAVAMTNEGSRQDSDGRYVSIWTLVNPATGSHTITVALASDTGGVVVFDGWSGVDTGTPTAGFAQSAINGIASPLSVTTAASATVDDIVIDAMCGPWNITFTDDASPSVQDALASESTVGYATVGASHEPGSAGAVTSQWTFAALQTCCIATVILKAALVGGGVAPYAVMSRFNSVRR